MAVNAATGHRERKKQRTRTAIVRVALELFAERGYDKTTLAEVAEAAGVSTRTIFSYFPGKEDILFSEYEAVRDTLARELTDRPSGQDALGTLREVILAVAAQKSEVDLRLEQIIRTDETLRSHRRARMNELQELLAAAIARDLGCSAEDLRPQVAAASLTAAFEVLEQQDSGSPRTHKDIAAAVDPIIAFVRAGLKALP